MWISSSTEVFDIEIPYPIGSMYAIYIYGNMDPINIPPMLAYIPAPWILWVLASVNLRQTTKGQWD